MRWFSMAAVRIRKFNAGSIKESRILFVLGKRHTGKSVLIRDILYHMPRPDYVLAMAPTEDTLKMFREFLPESCIFDHFSQEKLERTVSLQRELVSRGKKRTVLILLDDCMYQKGVLKSTAMRDIAMNGRHHGISLICAAQYMMDVDVSLRTNIDYVFTMRENILVNRQKLFKYFFGMFPKFDDFDKVMTACTQDYRALVLDGTIPNTENLTDCVMWYKANVDLPSFRLCRRVYWSWADTYSLSGDALRQAQQRQFEIENAAAQAAARQNAAAGGTAATAATAAGDGAGAKRGKKISMVQIEDEDGTVVANSV